MNIKKKINVLITLAAFCAAAQSAAFYKQPLYSLTTEKTIRLQDYHGKILLVSLFEPECRWCFKQMQVFNQITQECSNQLQPLAVGIHGQKMALRRELHRAQAQFPALQASPSWLKSVGEVPATPWTFILSSKGEMLAKIRGYFGFKNVQNTFSEWCKKTTD